MAFSYLPVTDTAINIGDGATPFAAGFNVVAHNNSGGALTLNGSDDGVNYTALVALADGAFQNITLPNYIQVTTAATIHLFGSP